ncbi:S-adenosyl-L-methionine-dependent methyltransferase [Multifurca ochricompacta]|uniref:S-adenosyl-L-methionine-dependent methyltransferase n=1 Tax=Multifurca ochricompacta TaxID=376703 RepID=A0AAD4LYM7_9AGAM|nr:S-adenosyl-L-methionine-dependent methyltransferase [Multifurca ochricompacta]
MENSSSKIRPGSPPQPSLQPADKKPRLSSSISQGGASLNAALKRNKKRKQTPPEPGSSQDVISREVITLLGKELVDQSETDGTAWESPFGFREEVQLTVSSISSSVGDGLAISPLPKRPWVVVVPFVLPGEVIRARVYRHAKMHSFADLISVEVPNSELRDMSRVKCKYFGTCAGCQYQMLSYETQLDLKRTIVVKAYGTYSNLPETSIPTIQSTIPSPLQYGYRTKITPHFDPPPKKLQKQGPPTSEEEKPPWLKIGFNQIGKRVVMDIEECPIATPVLNQAYTPMRENIAKNIYTYKKGVSLLLRDSLEIPGGNSPTATTELAVEDNHVCITDHKATVRERVRDLLFDYQAGSFFQNNNSVLVPLTSYVRDAIFPATPNAPSPTHLVDAYCGAGLFALTLAPHFTKVAGIELSADSIRFATHNAALNHISDKVTFRAGDAAQIFDVVGDFPSALTALVIDPPRKGCDEKFIRQLLAFGAQTVVYVSCNVHTQARDVGQIITWSAEEDAERKGRGKYRLESLRGFDLFPQTAHVESVAVLRLVSS